MTVEFLKRLPLFAGLDDNDLNWLWDMAEPVSIRAGQLLMQEGTPGDACYIVLEGEFEITKRSDNQDIKIAQREPGAVIGEMSLLDHSPRSASVRATTDARLLRISQNTFDLLLKNSSSAAIAIIHIVSDRLRQNEGLLRQSEKMAALGKMSAGLAHELNNPAAAVRRSSGQLRESLDEWQAITVELDELTHGDRQHERVHTLRGEITRRMAAPAELDPLTRSDRETDLQDWLEEHGVAEAWELAPALVAFGWDAPALAPLSEDFDAEQLSILTRWIAIGCSLHSLLNELYTGAERISEIVAAVKQYSYLDQAPIQEVDLHKGLDNTLVILRHKLKTGVKVTRHYDQDLPMIEAYGSELNQVWTNIIDNAIDAMDGQGEIVIRTQCQPPDQVVIEIGDNGPGIPPEIQKRIFEPFFTTKPPGVGSGLGLNIVYTTIHKHGGQIEVFSRPGSTRFKVTLPLRLRAN
jgi:signal transduction histidine kinase